MPLTPEEQLELDSLESEAGTVAQSGLSIAEQQELDSLNSEGGFSESPVFDEKTSGSAYDLSIESGVPLDESENLHSEMSKPQQQSDGLVKRFGKQLSNLSITSLVRGITSNVFSPLTISQEDASPYEKEAYDSLSKTVKLDELPVSDRIQMVRSEAKKIASERRFEGFPVTPAQGVPEKAVDTVAGVVGFMAQLAVLKRVAPSLPDAVAWDAVSQASGGGPGSGAAMQLSLGGIGKLIPGAGVLPAVGRGAGTSILFGTTTYFGGGDTEDILVNMAIPFAFEGAGVTRQVWAKYPNKADFFKSLREKAPALKKISDVEIDKAIGDTLGNIEPTTGDNFRAWEQDAAFGKSTSMSEGTSGRPAYEGQQFQGPSKTPQESPSTLPPIQFVRDRRDLEKEFAPKAATPEISEEVRAFQQQKRYSELLEKANAGDQKATKELNDYVQGTNLPTYEKLLEKATNGDQNAADLIQEGNYFGGPNARPELKVPETGKKPSGKPATAKTTAEPTLGQVEQTRRPTPTERAKANQPIIESDLKTPVDIAPEDLAKARERGFITSVKEVLPELKIEGQYIPRDTDTLAIKARNLIVDDIAKAEEVARKGSDQNAVAVASELIKHYGKQGNYEKAAEVAHDMAAKLTELGRAVQAASILARLTPEGQVRFAAREINKYNEKVASTRGGIAGLRKKIPNLTQEQAKYIMDEMQEIAKMPDGKAKYIRFKKLQDYISKLVPTPMYSKIITTWKAGLLTGIKTSGLNIMSNAFHLGTETIKDVPAAMVDKIAGYFTGTRTTTPTIAGIKKGGIEGFGKGLEYLKSGYSERDIGTKLDYHKVNYNTRAMQMYTEGIFRFLGSQDQPFYYAAKARSMYEQAKVSAMNLGLKGQKAQSHIDNLIQNPTERMIKLASKDAETAVFINNTTLGDIARGIQKLPGGEIVVPFGRTPSAVAMQIVNYSPIGIAKTIIENVGKGRFDQREFSQGIGRGITGTAVLAIGVELYKSGMITLDRPKDENELKLWELEGRQANSVLVNGKWRTVQAFGPAGNLLIIGGQFKRAFDEAGSPTEAMAEALAGSAKSFTEQTFMRGVSQFADALSDPERSAASMYGNMLASVIPTIVSDTARATDTQERRTESAGQKVVAKIPGARQKLEPKVTVLGEEKQPTANPLELMADPTRPSKVISTPVVDELRRLWDEGWEVSPSLLGDRKGFESLTPKENTILWTRAGSITRKGLETLITNPLYKDIPDDKKAEFIRKIVAESQKAARTEAVAQKVSKLKGKELADKLFELRKSGLATEELIPIQLSRQNPRKARKKK
jgi:hypothetical protein